MAFSRNTWKLTLSYDGGDFHGWQVQPGLHTVQGLLSEAIRKVTGEEVLPQGSGRTDAGVHALGQVATFDLEAGVPQQNLLRALNRALPASVRVTQAEVVPQGFHARHSACGKTYEYRIFVRRDAGTRHERICSPLLARYVWDCRWPLDIVPMQQAATTVIGEMDFSSFAANDPDVSVRQGATPPTTVRSISSSEWRREGDLLIYRVNGNGFLHHMVRNLVGTFVEMGCGRMSASQMPEILAARNRSTSGPTAPARGLFLVEVQY